MKPVFILPPAVLLALAPMAQAAPASATITVNGQSVAPNGGKVQCGYLTEGYTMQAGHDRGLGLVVITSSPSHNSQPARVGKVDIITADGSEYLYDLYSQYANKGQANYQGPPDPTKSSAGNYKVSGTIQEWTAGNGVRLDPNNRPMVPFEIDFTCP